jgi:hypothetical protein
MSGELGERAPDALTTGSAHEVSDNGDAVNHGPDGRCSIKFGIAPAPAEAVQVAEDQPEDCFAVPQRPSIWRDTLQHGGGLRWKRNGGTAR